MIGRTNKTQIKNKLTLHGFSYKTLESGVRVTALVPGSPSEESDEDFEVLVRATREGNRLESERLPSYEEAAARYVELIGKSRKDSSTQAHGPA
ncbi:MAG: hypothetical protein V5A48_13030 [Salinivenus sp.]